MLGGFQELTEPDARDSLSFIEDFLSSETPRLGCELACGIFLAYIDE